MPTRLLVVLALLIPALAHARPEPTIEIRGASKLPVAQLRAAAIAHQSTLLDGAGEIDADACDLAALGVYGYYLDHGYVMAKVGDPKIDREHHRVELTVTFEGDPFTISSVHLQGKPLLRTERAFLAMLQIKPGMGFDRSGIASDRQKLERFYQDRGYAYVNVLPLTKIDVVARTVGLTYEITPSELAFIERISVVGNTKTSTQSILDQVPLREGELYSGSKLEAARLRLLPQFRDLAVVVKRGSTAAAIEIVVEVDE